MAKTKKTVVLELSPKDARLLARFLDAACPDWIEAGKLGDVPSKVFGKITDQTGKENWGTREDRKIIREVQAMYAGDEE